MNNLASGTLLVANPHLDDPNFLRTVVFLCEHNNEGSFGFVLNRKLDVTIEELFPELIGCTFPVYEGGPVELHTLHFLHQYPNEIEGGQEVAKGIYWGGNFEQVKDLIHAGMIDDSKIRFFMGYSGWSEAQLEFEMDEKTWIVCDALPHFIFSKDETQLWKNVMNHLGGDYKLMIHAPVYPRMN